VSTIVVGVDSSAGAATALRWAAAEAQLRRAPLTVVHAYFRPLAYWGTDPGRGEEPERLRAQAILDDMLEREASVLLDVEVRPVLHAGQATRGLIQAAEGAELLVLGMRGAGGFEGLRLGSTAEHCARHAPCTVVVVPDPGGHGVTHGRILVGLDGSPQAEAALAWAVGEAALRGAAVDALTVYEPYRAHGPYGAAFMDVASPGWRRRFRQAAEQVAAEAVAGLVPPSTVPIETMVEEGHPSRVLAERSGMVDLIAVGHRGDTGLGELLLGSVPRQLLHHSVCPVAVVRTADRTR
jgi:nucleotide-binding universal stress UspA family protein